MGKKFFTIPTILLIVALIATVVAIGRWKIEQMHEERAVCHVGRHTYPVGVSFCGHRADQPQRNTLKGARFTCSMVDDRPQPRPDNCGRREICMEGTCVDPSRRCDTDADCTDGMDTSWCEIEEGRWVLQSYRDAPLYMGFCENHRCNSDRGTEYCTELSPRGTGVCACPHTLH